MTESNQTLQLSGKKIRLIRKQAGMTISEFADKAGVTSAYISQIEHDNIEPSLTVLRKLARALDVELPYLFANDVPTDVLVTTKDKRVDMNFIGGFAKFQFMMPSRLKNGERADMSVMIVTLSAGMKDNEEFVSHDHVEFSLVLEGEICYVTDKQEFLLKKGDSIYIKRNVPHLIYNKSDSETKMLAAMGSVVSRFTPHM